MAAAKTAGMTELLDYKKPSRELIAVANAIGASTSKAILLGTTSITEKTLFSNGLFQNILILYRLFDSLGYTPYLLVEKRLPDSIPGYRIILPEEILHNPIDVSLFIEVGMSVSTAFRAFLRGIGARIVKLYLGNVLNIDVESVHSTPGFNIAHHITGDIDEIWTSPHYGQHLEYVTVLNGLPVSCGKIAPYVWDRMFAERRMTRWSPVTSWRDADIVITEPNISFQKMFLMPLLLAQAYADAYPEWRGRVLIMNAERVRMNVHVGKTVLPALGLWRAGRVELRDRLTIGELTAAVRPGTVFVGHQWNNDFNYMTFELMLAGWPLLHNSVAWRDFGYWWTHEDMGAAVETLRAAMRKHAGRLETYAVEAEQLAWAHSVANPAVRAAWLGLLEPGDQIIMGLSASASATGTKAAAAALSKS
jgi:hypothetical protein